jgi:hypothetical protein
MVGCRTYLGARLHSFLPKFCRIGVYLTQRHIRELLYFKSIPLHITASGGIAKMSSLRHNNTTYQLKCIEEIHDNTCVVPVDVRRCSNPWPRVRLKGMPTRAWAGASQRRQGKLSHPLRLLEVFREYERLPRGSARGPMVQLSSSFMERIGVNEDGIATLGQEYLHSYDDAIRSVSKKVLHPTIPVNKQYNFSFAFNTPGSTSIFTASNSFMYFAPQDSDCPMGPLNLTLPANPPFIPVPLSHLLLENPTARQVLQDVYDQLLPSELAILRPVVELLVCQPKPSCPLVAPLFAPGSISPALESAIQAQ